MFDIHKVKPIHGWREFFGEVGIIVIGVLIALTGEQAVERLHYRTEMSEAREALKVEIESNLWSIDDRLRLTACVNARLNDIDRWADSQGTNNPLKLVEPVAGPTVQVTGTSVWRITTASVVGKMPFQDRVYYARLYDTLATADGLTERMADQWRTLGLLTDGETLTPAQVFQVRYYVRRLRSGNAILASDAKVLLSDGASKGLVPRNEASYVPELLARQRAFCRSIVSTAASR